MPNIANCDIYDRENRGDPAIGGKALRRHGTDAARLLAKIEAYAADPGSQVNNVKALAGSTALRLRVGDYRIVFEETATEIIVTKIRPRGSVYD